ncbi:MAG: hypothetical protein AB8G15_09830 [Saprospiraceae bacterium]
MKQLIFFLFVLFCINSTSAQIKMNWTLSKQLAFSKAKVNNSLVMVYYYNSENDKLTTMVEENIFYASEKGSWSPNYFVEYMNERLFAMKKDLDLNSISKEASQLNLNKYPAFIWYYPNGEEAHRIIGGEKSDGEMLELVKQLNDEFQEATLLTKGTASYLYLADRLEEDLKDVSNSCDHIGCAYPVIHRSFKAVPKGVELPYLLEKSLVQNALDLDGPEIIWLLNNLEDLEKEDKVYAIYETILFEIVEKNGAQLSEETFLKELEGFMKDKRLDKFPSYKADVLVLIKEELAP